MSSQSQQESERLLRRAVPMLAPAIQMHFDFAHFEPSTQMLLSRDGLYGLAFNQQTNDGTVFLFEIGEGG